VPERSAASRHAINSAMIAATIGDFFAIAARPAALRVSQTFGCVERHCLVKIEGGVTCQSRGRSLWEAEPWGPLPSALV
jgi:hypothetical protein